MILAPSSAPDGAIGGNPLQFSSSGGNSGVFAGVRQGAPVRNSGAAGSRGVNRILPFQDFPVFFSPGAAAWSPWSDITPGEATDRILTHLWFSWTPVGRNNMYLQIGTGAVGAEVPIFEYSIDNNISGSGATPFTTEDIPIPFIKVVAGTRIAIRGYGASALAGNVPFVGVYIDTINATQNTQYWDTWVDTYVTGAKVARVFTQPAIPTTITITAGAGYTTVINAVATDIIVLGYGHNSVVDGFSMHGQLAIAHGPAGSEIDDAYLGCPGSLLSFRYFGSGHLSNPILIKKGERMSSRYDYSSGGTMAGNFWIAALN